MIQKTIIIDHLKINYYESDDFSRKGTLVFLHGWLNDALIFQDIFREVNNFIALDLPGFGLSEKPKSAWFLKDYAWFLKNFLIKKQIVSSILVGHSFGGSLALKYELLFSDHTKKLILIGSAGIRRKKTVKKVFLSLLVKIGKFVWGFLGIKNKENGIKKWFYTLIGSDYYTTRSHSVWMSRIFQNIIQEDLSCDLSKIEVPTFMIWGDKDRMTSIEDGKLMQRLIPLASIFVIQGGGHHVFLDKKKQFIKVFKQILLK